ncbi:MAG: N-acetyltransferase [Hyphomicrobium sp.]|jgi:predicted N-acetyltransferase YhbS|nr:N-acetyltransferase [Hyphomicrobium sp.]
MKSSIVTRPATGQDLAAITALQARVFGPGRFARSAYRVREGHGLMSRFCRVADCDGRLIATVRITVATIGGVPGAALLGPVAVDPEFRGQGYGRQLVSEALDALKAAGFSLVVLVGDEPYYGRFGFKPVPFKSIAFPGPVNPARILAVELVAGALPRYRGLVAAAPTPDGGGNA